MVAAVSGFRKAEKRQAKLRLALDGPSGSGKTWTGLVTATALANGGGGVAVIDTEHGSASLYADRFRFDVLELRGNYDPGRYVAAMRDAEQAGYNVILIDSLSHAWEAEGGIQEIADRNKKGGNTWSGWAAATPAYRSLIEAILASPLHVICTMRTKTEWGVDEKNKPVKIGTAPVMRAGIDFEFTVVGDLDTEHVMWITKSRCPAVADKSYRHPGPEFGRTLLDWLEDGAPALPEPWVERWALLLESHDEGTLRTLLHGADPVILGRDDAWDRFKAVVAEQAGSAATGAGDDSPGGGASPTPQTPPAAVTAGDVGDPGSVDEQGGGTGVDPTAPVPQPNLGGERLEALKAMPAALAAQDAERYHAAALATIRQAVTDAGIPWKTGALADDATWVRVKEIVERVCLRDQESAQQTIGGES